MKINNLKIKSTTENLKEIRAFIKNIAQISNFTKDTIDSIILAADEACTNVIRHAYKSDKTKDIDITTQSEPDKLTIKIRDYGIKPDLQRLENPPKEKLRTGRYGVVFIKTIMDEINYDLSPKKGTILTLTKYTNNERK